MALHPSASSSVPSGFSPQPYRFHTCLAFLIVFRCWCNRLLLFTVSLETLPTIRTSECPWKWRCFSFNWMQLLVLSLSALECKMILYICRVRVRFFIFISLFGNTGDWVRWLWNGDQVMILICSAIAFERKWLPSLPLEMTPFEIRPSISESIFEWSTAISLVVVEGAERGDLVVVLAIALLCILLLIPVLTPTWPALCTDLIWFFNWLSIIKLDSHSVHLNSFFQAASLFGHRLAPLPKSTLEPADDLVGTSPLPFSLSFPSPIFAASGTNGLPKTSSWNTAQPDLFRTSPIPFSLSLPCTSPIIAASGSGELPESSLWTAALAL